MIQKSTQLHLFGVQLGTAWRSGWDSNPRALAGYLISSQARYDHFDTAPQFKRQAFCLSFGIKLVEVARLELAASWSLTMRATNCATPRKKRRGRFRCLERKTGIEPATFSLGSYCSTVEPFPHSQLVYYIIDYALCQTLLPKF